MEVTDVIKERVVTPQGSFMVVVFGNDGGMPQFYDSRRSPPRVQLGLELGLGLELEIELGLGLGDGRRYTQQVLELYP